MMIAYIIAYLASYLCARAGQFVLSGLILILTAIALYVSDYLKTESLINLRGLFALSFVGGEGVSCLKLSYIQTDWANETWLSFFLAFMAFYLLYEIAGRYTPKFLKNASFREIRPERFYSMILIITGVSLAAFLIEASILGFVPLFVQNTPHAYSYFHISGVHYFTVLCVLVPAFSVIWILDMREKERTITRGNRIWLIVVNVIALAIPVLCVSRFQLFSAIIMAVFAYLLKVRRLPWKWILPLALVIAGSYLLLSAARSHGAEYLNSVFEMKINLPVDISRIYIYIANNYDNFDCLVKQIEGYTWGLHQLYPVFALTGLKFVFPELTFFPFYLTKPELTTLTLIYDFYYDFGIAGVFAGTALVAALCFGTEYLVRIRKDNAAGMLYVQLALYMLLAFFTTWFSNPTTFFYFAVTIIGYLICTKKKE